MQSADDRLIVALDVPNAVAGLELADRLGDSVSFYKIGLGMLTGGGLALANELKAMWKRLEAGDEVQRCEHNKAKNHRSIER